MPGHKVLVVDDDRDTLALYSTALALSGFEVVAAENGVQALRLVDRESPDAVVTDLAMPGMDGVALCRHLRSKRAARRVPVVAVSGQLSPALTSDARRAGCDEVLTKPCLPDELVETIGRLIESGPGCAPGRGATRQAGAGNTSQAQPRGETARARDREAEIRRDGRRAGSPGTSLGPGGCRRRRPVVE